MPITDARVLAANSATAQLLHQHFGLLLPLWNVALQVLLVTPSAPLTIAHLIGHAPRTVAIKSEHHQVVISGGFRGRWVAGDDPS